MIYFKRMNETHITVTETGAVITAAPGTEFFSDPVSGSVKADAPFYYKEVSGDFVLAAKINLNFSFEEDEAFLLAMFHEQLWIKAGIRYFDKKGYTIVSSITDGYSDTSYAFHVECAYLWLKLTRRGDVFSVYYSLNGKEFDLLRQTRLTIDELLKAGIGAASPKWKPQNEDPDSETSHKAVGRNISFEDVRLDQKADETVALDTLADFFG